MLMVSTLLINPNRIEIPLEASVTYLTILSGSQERNLTWTEPEGQHKYVLAQPSIQRVAATPKLEERKDSITKTSTRN